MSTKKLFEGAVLVGFSVSHPGDKKSSRELTGMAADRLNLDSGLLGTHVLKIPGNRVQRIRQPAQAARNLMKRLGIVWTANTNNAYGGRLSQGQYLLMSEQLVEFSEGMERYRMQWEDLKRTELFSQWPNILEDYAKKLDRALADATDDIDRRAAYIAYNPDNFPSLDKLKKSFSWDVKVDPLLDIADIQKDIRLRAPAEVMEQVVKDAKRNQAMRISNAVGSMAERVIDMTANMAEAIHNYDPDPKDKRKGNTLPKGPSYKNLSELADTLENVNKVLDDSSLADTVEKMREFEDHIDSITAGSGTPKEQAAAIRKVLKKGGGDKDKIVEGLDSITNTAVPALSKFDEFMS